MKSNKVSFNPPYQLEDNNDLFAIPLFKMLLNDLPEQLPKEAVLKDILLRDIENYIYSISPGMSESIKAYLNSETLFLLVGLKSLLQENSPDEVAALLEDSQQRHLSKINHLELQPI